MLEADLFCLIFVYLPLSHPLWSVHRDGVLLHVIDPRARSDQEASIPVRFEPPCCEDLASQSSLTCDGVSGDDCTGFG